MKELINNIFNEELTKVDHSFPSLYSKEDVISLLGRIKMDFQELEVSDRTNIPVIGKELLATMFEDVLNEFSRVLDRGDREYIDISTAELSIDYHNHIVIDSIDICIDVIADSLGPILESVFYEALDVRD